MKQKTLAVPLTIRRLIGHLPVKWQQRVLLRKAGAGEEIPRRAFEPIDYSCQPASYWSANDLRQLVANIKGAERKKRALQLIREGRLEQASDFVLSDALSEEDRKRAGQIHPALMGGEYLPDYAEAEVEIARVTMASITQDVVSIRARAVNGRIHYRAVDEYESQYIVNPEASSNPLTLRQLIHVIDTAKRCDGPLELGPLLNLEFTGDSVDACADIMRFSSEFYPELRKHYWFVQQRWLQQSRARRVAQ